MNQTSGVIWPHFEMLQLHHESTSIVKNQEVRAERLKRLAVVEHYFEPLVIDDVVARNYEKLTSAISATGRNHELG